MKNQVPHQTFLFTLQTGCLKKLNGSRLLVLPRRSRDILSPLLTQKQNIKLKNDFIKKGAFVDLILMNDASVVIVFKKENKDNVFKIYYSNKDKNLKEYPLALANQVFKKVKFEVDNKNNKLLIGFK